VPDFSKVYLKILCIISLTTGKGVGSRDIYTKNILYYFIILGVIRAYVLITDGYIGDLERETKK